MKQYLLYLGAATLVLTACSKDASEPAFVAAFDASRTVVDSGERVLLTNTTVGAVRYEWDLGDGQKATTDTTSVYYYDLGNHTVKLTTYDAKGRTATTTKTIRIGQRYLTRVDLTAMRFEDSQGLPWDADGSGPDMYLRLRFVINTVSSPVFSSTIADVQPGNLPLSWTLDQAQLPPLSYGAFDWDSSLSFTFHNANPGATDRSMFSYYFPKAPSANRDAEGNGFYEVTPVGSPWRMVFHYETR
jgi:PKD repeat protein